MSGGAERVITIKANWFATHGHKVDIITFQGEKERSFYPLEPTINVIELNLPPYKNYITYYFRTILPGKKLIKSILFEKKYDIFISAFPFLETYIPKLKDGSKKIYEIHCSQELNKSIIRRQSSNALLRSIKTIKYGLKNRCLRKFDRIVLLTKQEFNERNCPKNAIVIPNPNTFVFSERASLDEKNVISVGRLSFEKGYDYLLQAWKIVHRKFPDWKLNIYGFDKGEKSKLNSYIFENNLSSNVSINEPVKDIRQKYLKSSIYVLSSRHEGFPMVLGEAMTCGLPCIAFRCKTGPDEIITHNEDGILVSEVGDTDGLSSAICKLIEDKSLRKEFGEKAKDNIRRFDLDKIMEQWDVVLHELIKL